VKAAGQLKSKGLLNITQMDDYRSFTTNDFVADEYFQQWIYHPSPETNIFWQSWLAQNPDKAELIQAARRILSDLEVQDEIETEETRKNEIWDAITAANAAFDASAKTGMEQPAGVRRRMLPQWSRIAASILLLMIVGVGIVMIGKNGDDGTIEQRTSFGETRTVVLPDRSTVVLNANSKISYSGVWKGEGAREIWLDGEAYFSVVHTASDQKFIVHTSKDVSVEVLGTTFDVLRRADRTRVVLNSGSIKLNLYTDDKHEEVLMKPGELLEFKQEPSTYVKKKANADHFSSWTENKLTFDGTPLSDLVSVLQENYGLHVTLADTTLQGQKLWGSVPSNDATLLLEAISSSFNFSIHKDGKEILISDKREKRPNNKN
jgi:transmembrane sensor